MTQTISECLADWFSVSLCKVAYLCNLKKNQFLEKFNTKNLQVGGGIRKFAKNQVFV